MPKWLGNPVVGVPCPPTLTDPCPRGYFVFSPTESPMIRATVPNKSTATATKVSSFWGNRGELRVVTPVL